MKLQKRVPAKGQGIVEYILITAMVALATIAMFKTFREDLKTAYKKAGEALVKGVEESIAPSSNGNGAN